MDDPAKYESESGRFVPVWTLEFQTLPEETDRILDAVMAVHPLSFDRYRRNASISAVGKETARTTIRTATIPTGLGTMAGVCPNGSADQQRRRLMTANVMRDGFDTRPIEMQPMWLVAFQAPAEDVDRVFEAVAEVAPLAQGNTDRNGYRAPDGLEYYRPREGTPTGAEDEVRKRPGVDEMRFFLPRDAALLLSLIHI